MNDPHRLGEALAFAEHAAGDTPHSPWQLLTTRTSGSALRAGIEHVQTQLRSPDGAAAEVRVAASTEQFGLVARLVSAHLCARALGWSLNPSAGATWWQQHPGRLMQLSVERLPQAGSPWQHGAIPEIIDIVQQLYGVSEHVLWGNVGSAANSTLALLRGSRPDLVDAAQEAADGLLQDPRIDGGALHTSTDFRRRSCCLIYRTGIQMCGDCVLRS